MLPARRGNHTSPGELTHCSETEGSTNAKSKDWRAALGASDLTLQGLRISATCILEIISKA